MEPLPFKYHLVNEYGYAGGIFACKGELTEKELRLKTETIPVGQILSVTNRQNRLAIAFNDRKTPRTVVLEPKGGMDRKLKAAIDRLCSYRWSETRYAELERQGLGAAFRTVKCPTCAAAVDLTGFEETPYYFCPYCETIQCNDEAVAELPPKYRLCDRCQFFSKPQQYTEFYAVLNYAQWQQHFACHVCMRSQCRKMMLINLLPPFIGFPVAIYLAARAYGGAMLDKDLPELAKANALGTKGKVDAAEPIYAEMLERWPHHAGLRYNLALSHARAKDWEGCLEMAQIALEDCSNYTPAGTLVSEAMQKLGDTPAAQNFLSTWGMPKRETRTTPPPLPGAENIQATRENPRSDAVRDPSRRPK